MQQIVVTGLQGKRDILNVAKTCSIDQLYTEVLKTSAPGVTVDELRLVYGGSELERGKGHTIATHEIPQMGQIFMVIRLRGGGGGGGGACGVVGGGGCASLPLPIGSLVCGDVVSTTYDPDVITFDCDYSSDRLKMPCGHAIGSGTLLAYCTSIVDCGKLLFPCPSCGCNWSYAFIRKALQLKGEAVETLDYKVSDKSFRVTPGFQKCPGGGCSIWLFRDPAEDRGVASTSSTRCPVCGQVFCWFCLRRWTSTVDGVYCGYSDCSKGVDPRILFMQSQPLKTIGLVSGCPSVRGCLRCGTLLEHKEACKHVVCKSCNLQFCFVCLKPFTGQWQCGAHNSVCAVAPLQSTLPQLLK